MFADPKGTSQLMLGTIKGSLTSIRFVPGHEDRHGTSNRERKIHVRLSEQREERSNSTRMRPSG
jgi:hypothetical protein